MAERAAALALADEILYHLSTGYAYAPCLTPEKATLLCRALKEACAELETERDFARDAAREEDRHG